MTTNNKQSRRLRCAILSGLLVAVPLAGALPIHSAHAASMLTPGTIVTIAGGGMGSGGSAAYAALTNPSDAVPAPGGGFYVVGDNRILQVSSGGAITNVAGDGIPGFSGDGGPASMARVNGVQHVALDAAGNLFIADRYNNRIRRIDLNGIITTVAGSGTSGFNALQCSTGGFSGDGGPATSAQLAGPGDVNVTPDGSILIADNCNLRVRRVSPGGIIGTIAGNGLGIGFDGGQFYASGHRATDQALGPVVGVKTDREGRVLVVGALTVRRIEVDGTLSTVAGDFGQNRSGFDGDNGPAASATFDTITGIAVDATDSMYIADSVNNRIRRVDAAGTITTVAGTGPVGWFAGRFSGDNQPATDSRLALPGGVELDSGGQVLVADTGNHRIRSFVPGGSIATLAGSGHAAYTYGDGGPAAGAGLGYTGVAGWIYNLTGGLALDSSGALLIASTSRVRRIGRDGLINSIAGSDDDCELNRACAFGDGGPATKAGVGSADVAIDSTGGIILADRDNNRVRRIDPQTGVINTIAGWGPRGYDTTNGSYRGGYSGDGGLAIHARLNEPTGVAVGPDGSIYIADTLNDVVRRIAPGTSVITTFAGGGSTENPTYAGPPTGTKITKPTGLAVDSQGNLFISEWHGNIVREVTSHGIMITVAGNGQPGFVGDGGPAIAAELNFPVGLAVDNSGNLFIADAGNLRVRRVDVATKTISTVAGNGVSDFSGDGGGATQASLVYPSGVAVDSAGNLFIFDAGLSSGTAHIRVVAGSSYTPPQVPPGAQPSAPSLIPPYAPPGGIMQRHQYTSSPSDPYFPLQWGLQDIHAPQAWQQTGATGSGVTVAVIDKGVDITAPDLACPGKVKLLQNSDLDGIDGIAADYTTGTGTAAAGVIGACANDGVGMAGVAPDATILPIRDLGIPLAVAFKLAVDSGAQVLYFGFPGESDPTKFQQAEVVYWEKQAIAAGMIVIVPAAPARSASASCGPVGTVCVGVSTSDHTTETAAPMRTDGGLYVVAPGGTAGSACDSTNQSVLSLVPDYLDNCDEGRDGYRGVTGTGIAAAHVAGVAALIYDHLGGTRSQATASTVLNALRVGAIPEGALSGAGRVDALNAILALGLSHIDLSPANATTGLSQSQSFTAIGRDQFGNSLGDVTGATTFTITPDGSCIGSSCKAATLGPHTVTGHSGSATGTASLNVIDDSGIDHIIISPSSSTIQSGGSQAYVANGYDKNNVLIGDVTSTTVFAITPNGSCSGAACTATLSGSHTVTGTRAGKTSASSLGVTPGPATHLLISPLQATIVERGSQSFTAQGIDANGNTTGDLTSKSTFSIAPDGSCSGATCTASTAGKHLVTATDGTLNGQAPLVVIPNAPTITDPAEGALTRGSVTVAGTAEPNQTVRVFDGLVQIADDAVSDAHGHWSISLSLGNGIHEIMAKEVIGSDESDASNVRKFTVKASSPTVSISAPLGSTSFLSVYMPGSRTLKGFATDDLGVISVALSYKSLLTGQIVKSETATCLDCPGTEIRWLDQMRLAPGLYEVTAVATDPVGNKSAPAKQNFITLGF